MAKATEFDPHLPVAILWPTDRCTFIVLKNSVWIQCCGGVTVADWELEARSWRSSAAHLPLCGRQVCFRSSWHQPFRHSSQILGGCRQQELVLRTTETT